MFYSFLDVYQRVNGGFTEKKGHERWRTSPYFSCGDQLSQNAMVDYSVPMKLPLVYEGIPPFLDKPR